MDDAKKSDLTELMMNIYQEYRQGQAIIHE